MPMLWRRHKERTRNPAKVSHSWGKNSKSLLGIKRWDIRKAKSKDQNQWQWNKRFSQNGLIIRTIETPFRILDSVQMSIDRFSISLFPHCTNHPTTQQLLVLHVSKIWRPQFMNFSHTFIWIHETLCIHDHWRVLGKNQRSEREHQSTKAKKKGLTKRRRSTYIFPWLWVSLSTF